MGAAVTGVGTRPGGGGMGGGTHGPFDMMILII